MRDVTNSKPLKVFVKGAFVLIGLIFVLSYGVVAFILHYNRIIENVKGIETEKIIETENKIKTENKTEKDKKTEFGVNLECKFFVLILILVCLPILVFVLVLLRFSCLLKFHYDKLYNFSYIGHEEKNYKMFIKMIPEIHKIETMKEVCPKEVEEIKSYFDKFFNVLKKIEEIIEEYSKKQEQI